ncbi:MAG: hypothetical protein M1832_005751 [Thelocarpon impressellum]|nr:MAG: hypothetical protein M1832_005751 [Thelocarpon impressellum]
MPTGSLRSSVNLVYAGGPPSPVDPDISLVELREPRERPAQPRISGSLPPPRPSTMSSGSASLQPTYQGHVATTHDALALFEACLSGELHHVPRRPHDRERGNLIRSGCVFIYEENASGIKRWTDGVPWSPSRILGNFLVYRELLKPFPPGEKKRATKRTKRTSKPGEPYPRPQLEDGSPTSPTPPSFRAGETVDRETERSLIGSLVDSYGFKDDGLVKKTMSVTVNGVHHHLVSYYKVEDVVNGVLEAPSQNLTLRSIRPRHELTSRQNFRAPLDELDDGLDGGADGQRNPYGYGERGAFERRPGMAGQAYHQQPGPPHNTYPYSGVEGPYLGGPHPHGPVSSSYGVTAPAPTAVQPYYAQAGMPQVPPKPDDYAAYAGPGPGPGPAPYPSAFDPLGNSGVGHGPALGVERAPQQQAQPMHYMQPQLRARPSNVPESPTMLEGKSPTDGYNRAYYPAPGRAESGHGQYGAAEGQRWTSPTTTSRSENVPAYAQAPEKQGYWPVAGHVGNGHGHGHGHYPSPSSTPRWSHPSV